ncbi:hypothetical protein PSKAS_08830 [Peribacillus sp. N1]
MGNALKLASAFTSFPGCHVYEKYMEYANDWHAFIDDTIILLITTKDLNDRPIYPVMDCHYWFFIFQRTYFIKATSLRVGK